MSGAEVAELQRCEREIAQLQQAIDGLRRSWSYRLGWLLLAPFGLLARLVGRRARCGP